MQQLCLIAVTFKIKQTGDLHFDHIYLIYEFPLWCDRLRTVGAAINQMSVCVCVQGSFLFSIHLAGDWSGNVKASNANQTKTAVGNRQFYLFSQFISGKCFPLSFNISHCSCSFACKCWLSNKLMVCLITLLGIWQCIEGGPPEMLLKMDQQIHISIEKCTV